MRTYVIMIARNFMKSHPRAGENTDFAQKIWKSQSLRRGDGHWSIYHTHPHQLKSGLWQFPVEWADSWSTTVPKLHTIRLNYDLWAARAEQINSGTAVLSLRQWLGKPYRSKQVEILRLEKIGVQRISISRIPISGKHLAVAVAIEGVTKSIDVVCKNDGLSVDDFMSWFKKDFDGCVIHFTENFRY